jgi:hypothetical protein
VALDLGAAGQPNGSQDDRHRSTGSQRRCASGRSGPMLADGAQPAMAASTGPTMAVGAASSMSVSRDGKRKYVSGPTQAEALAKLRQAQREADVGIVSDDRMTIGHFLARWSTVNLPGQVSGTTLDDYTLPPTPQPSTT